MNYISHNENEIKGFFGEYRWLSNFHPCKVVYEGQEYPSVEHAYQASKTRVKEKRKEVLDLSAAAAKKWGQGVVMEYDKWDKIRAWIMFRLVDDKFSRNPSLQEKLLDTGEKYLEETNNWGDTYWGVDEFGNGDNILGQILMAIRSSWGA